MSVQVEVRFKLSNKLHGHVNFQIREKAPASIHLTVTFVSSASTSQPFCIGMLISPNMLHWRHPKFVKRKGGGSYRETNTVERPPKLDRLSSGQPKDAAGVGFITRHHPAVLPTSCDAVTRFIKLFGVLSVVSSPKAQNPIANGLCCFRLCGTSDCAGCPYHFPSSEKMITDTDGIAESHEDDEMSATLMGTIRDQRTKFHVQFKLIVLKLLGGWCRLYSQREWLKRRQTIAGSTTGENPGSNALPVSAEVKAETVKQRSESQALSVP
ncbi:hypothetical protein EDB86DRAFT_2828527 [Lactarius hatsudake]|nr:hypothetical protein EDB86DRAFT_2828527 [Lactarius hatsudake]